jgi:hypothetical protein
MSLYSPACASKAEIRVARVGQLAIHNRTRHAGIFRDLPYRRLDGPPDDVDTDPLVVIRRVKTCQDLDDYVLNERLLDPQAEVGDDADRLAELQHQRLFCLADDKQGLASPIR